MTTHFTLIIHTTLIFNGRVSFAVRGVPSVCPVPEVTSPLRNIATFAA